MVLGTRQFFIHSEPEIHLFMLNLDGVRTVFESSVSCCGSVLKPISGSASHSRNTVQQKSLTSGRPMEVIVTITDMAPKIESSQ